MRNVFEINVVKGMSLTTGYTADQHLRDHFVSCKIRIIINMINSSINCFQLYRKGFVIYKVQSQESLVREAKVYV